MSKEEATEIFIREFRCQPEQFMGINEPYYTLYKPVEEAMKVLGVCALCLGSGTSWAECCNGSGGCPCNGEAVSFRCNICLGTGRLSGYESGNENLNYLIKRGTANRGYLFSK